MKCSLSTYYRIIDSELYNFEDGYMQLNADIDAKTIDLEKYISEQKKRNCGDVSCASRKCSFNISDGIRNVHGRAKKGNSYVQQMPEMRKEADRPREH